MSTMETLTDKLRDLLLEDEIYNNIMKDAEKKISERTDMLRDFLLADEIFNIMKDAVKEILDRTEGYKSARERLILTLFSHCIITLTDSRYNIDEKIAHSKEEAEGCVNIIDADIEIEKWKRDRNEEQKEGIKWQLIHRELKTLKKVCQKCRVRLARFLLHYAVFLLPLLKMNSITIPNIIDCFVIIQICNIEHHVINTLFYFGIYLSPNRTRFYLI